MHSIAQDAKEKIENLKSERKRKLAELKSNKNENKFATQSQPVYHNKIQMYENEIKKLLKERKLARSMHKS